MNSALLEADEYLASVWPSILKEWQADAAKPETGKRSIALVTRDCSQCGTRVRSGVVMHGLVARRPAGDRAYCSKCKEVTTSPVFEVRGLLITDDDEEEAQ